MRRICEGLLLAGIACAVAPASAQEVTLRLHHFNPPTTTMHTKFIVPWTQMVAEKSAGKVKVEIYPAMQLGGRPQQLVDQIKDGVVDIAWTIPGYTAGRFPHTEVFELPFVHQDVASSNKSLVEFTKSHLVDEMKDYKVLALHVHAGNVLITRDKGIRTVEDFKGMKLRGANQSGVWYLESVGANPVGSPITEVAQLLSRGVIDGAALPFEIIGPFKLHELTKFNTELAKGRRFQTTVFFLGMNNAKFNSLTAQQRAAIDAATGTELVDLVTKVWEDAEEPGIQAAKARGHDFIKMTDAESARMEKLAEPVYQRWIAAMKERNIDGTKVLADARALIVKHQKK